MQYTFSFADTVIFEPFPIIVVSVRVCHFPHTLHQILEAFAFIDVSISANQEAVSDVTPSIAIDMPVLDT